MRKLTKQNLYDILLGTAILSTGGGTSLEDAYRVIDKALEDGCEFLLAGLNEIPDEALVGTPYGCGSPSPLSEEQIIAYERIPKIKVTPEITAVKTVEKYLGRELFGIASTELGPMNASAALNVAARTGKPIIDGEPTGRCAPTVMHTTYYLNNIPIYPMGIASEFGDAMVITRVENDERAEAIARAVSMASFNHVGVVDHVLEWKALKKAILKNTLSMCMRIGQIMREAREENRNLAYDIVKEFNGFIMFEGTISKTDWEDKDGFTYGNIYINGEGEFEGDELRIWFQNEHIMSWKNNEVYVTVPDSINVIDCNENMPIQNPNAREGMKVTVMALKAFDEWRTEKGLEIFGPKFFGYDVEYRKVEDIFL